MKEISEVSLGDRVLAYSPASQSFSYSQVVAIPHEKNDLIAVFQHIVTVDRHELVLTPDHLLLAGECSQGTNGLSLFAAASVSRGLCLLSKEGALVEVSSSGVTNGRGVYTIVAEEELIVVNGLVASPFAINHYVANKFYDIHRITFNYFPTMLKSKILRWIDYFARGLAEYATAN